MEMGSWCRRGSAPSGLLSTSKGWLRRYLLLKLVTVLLLPHTAGVPLLVGCVFSLRALLLLHSPHTSTKPSTVLLARLALTDSVVPLHWMLQLAGWMEEARRGTATGLVEESACWREALGAFCQRLLDTHHLASLLLLGLLGLEAVLVSRWPQQTLRFRTSHWAQLCCNLVWILVLLELCFSLQPNCLQDSRSETPQTSPSSFLGVMPDVSSCLRRTLWLVNLWLHYAVLFHRPQKGKSSFH
uniref:uncharacterized protein LOC120818297 n=1 Tax=Gasterosteus aculeatus aculeatus TaxID=481459 RepID=UPI001A98E9B6|nr:uncharacterized protein LOC120818297 [Gasterosteus aculeatus aculeatus]